MFMDHDLARRLERTEGAMCASFVAARAVLEPARGACWHDFAGTYAMYDGANSPMTQTFGLGIFAPASPEQLIAEIRVYFLSGAAISTTSSPSRGRRGARVARRAPPTAERAQHRARAAAHRCARPARARRVARLGAPRRRATSRVDRGVGRRLGGRLGDGHVHPRAREDEHGERRDDAISRRARRRDGRDRRCSASTATSRCSRRVRSRRRAASAAQRMLPARRLADARARGCTTAMMAAGHRVAAQRRAQRVRDRVHALEVAPRMRRAPSGGVADESPYRSVSRFGTIVVR